MKHLVRGMTALSLLAVFCPATHAQTMKLNDVLVFNHLDVKAEADPKAFAASAGWEVHLLRKDRGNRPGRYLVVVSTSRQTSAAPTVTSGVPFTESREYRLVGADRVAPLPEVDVLGIHYLQVRPERRDAFDRFVIEKLHPAVGNLRPDLRLLYYKAVSGGDAGELPHDLRADPRVARQVLAEGTGFRRSEGRVQASASTHGRTEDLFSGRLVHHRQSRRRRVRKPRVGGLGARAAGALKRRERDGDTTR